MRILVLILFILPFLMAYSETAPINAPTETQEIEVFLVDEEEAPTNSYNLALENSKPQDLRFKHLISGARKNYISWALEFSDPVRNLNKRIASDGKAPESIYWDGVFDSTQPIKLKGRYYYRLILVAEDEKLYSSAWTSFSTRLKSRSEGVKTNEKFIGMTITPTIGMESQSIKTKTYSDPGIALLGDLKFSLNDKHTFALRYEATCDRFFILTSAKNNLNFSDFSYYYRYNLIGGPLRAGSSTNDIFVMQLGTRGFASVIRGEGNLPVDSESARSYQGFTGTLNLEQRLGSFRLLEGAEWGYSILKSKHIVMGFEGALSYEGFQFVGVGVHAKYSVIVGKPEYDSNDGGNAGSTTISNKILMAGLSLYFKI